MPRVLRRDALLLKAGTVFRKKTSAVWELDEQPKEEKGFVFYYEDIRPDLRVR